MLRSFLRVLELRGLQASGKTTFARGILSKYGNAARVSRDDLRQMMFMGNYRLDQEPVVKAVEQAAGKAILDNNYDLIVDDTNLTGSKAWQDLATASGAKHSIRKFEVSVETAVKRDAERARPVGRAAIQATARRAKV